MDDVNKHFFRENLRLTHNSSWRQNHHARLLSILRLSVHHYDYLFSKDPEEANAFLTQLLAKIVNNSSFYNILKQNLTYPQVINSLIKLQSRLENPS